MSESGRRFGVASSGSLTVHGAIVLSLLVASHLRVEPLGQPRIPVTMIMPIAPSHPPGTPSPPPPPAGSAAPAGRPPARVDVALRPAPRAAQPRQLLEALSPIETVPGQGASREDAGGGDSYGVPGGTGPGGGLPWGIAGGTGTGAGPGNVLEGLPDGRPVHLTADVTPPAKMVDVTPIYPEAARLSRTAGTVVLQIVIGREGDVEEAVVLRSAPLFDDAALAAVRQWKYRPALRGGRPVRVYQTVRVVFAIR